VWSKKLVARWRSKILLPFSLSLSETETGIESRLLQWQQRATSKKERKKEAGEWLAWLAAAGGSKQDCEKEKKREREKGPSSSSHASKLATPAAAASSSSGSDTQDCCCWCGRHNLKAANNSVGRVRNVSRCLADLVAAFACLIEVRGEN
jgi:hypothetical protein